MLIICKDSIDWHRHPGAGRVQISLEAILKSWIPACAGMTSEKKGAERPGYHGLHSESVSGLESSR
jgi:hypothetical protein